MPGPSIDRGGTERDNEETMAASCCPLPVRGKEKKSSTESGRGRARRGGEKKNDLNRANGKT